MIDAVTKKQYNPKSAKNLETFPPKFQVPDKIHTEPDPSLESKSQNEEEKKNDSLGSGFASYSFLKAQSEQSISSRGNSARGPIVVKKFSRESSVDKQPLIQYERNSPSPKFKVKSALSGFGSK